jgi:hypothetical protein
MDPSTLWIGTEAAFASPTVAAVYDRRYFNGFQEKPALIDAVNELSRRYGPNLDE